MSNVTIWLTLEDVKTFKFHQIVKSDRRSDVTFFILKVYRVMIMNALF